MTPKTLGNMGKGRIRGVVRNPTRSYTVSFWFRNDIKSDSTAMTAYLFSFSDHTKPFGTGDHLGLSGNYRGGKPGNLFVYPGS
ncbi:MAG: hypothetical protein ACPGVU_11210, partial [Limisphaerales bacterium]